MTHRTAHYSKSNFIASTRKDASPGEGRWRARILTPDHKQIASKMHANKPDAEQWGQDYLYLLRKGITVGLRETSDPTLTTADIIDRFLSDDKAPGRDWALPRVRQLNIWREAIGDIPAVDLETWHIEDSLAEFAEGEAMVWSPAKGEPIPTGRDRTPGTVNRHLCVIKAALKWASKPPQSGVRGAPRHALLPTNPAAGVTTQPENNERTDHLSRSQVDEMLERARTANWDRYYCFLLGLVTTGSRKNEWLRMTWDRIDLDARTAFVPTTKNGEPKTLSLGPAMVTELHRIRSTEPAIGTTLLFPSITDPAKPYDHRRQWSATRKAMGLDGYRLHDLRHTCASLLLESGHTLSQTAEILGHKSLTSTKRYSHMGPQARQDITDAAFGDIGA